MNAEQLNEYRELAERLSYFGLEGRAQSAITALLAECERLTVRCEMAAETANKYLAKYEERVSRVSDLNAQVATLTAERDALAAELATVRAQLTAASAGATYRTGCHYSRNFKVQP